MELPRYHQYFIPQCSLNTCNGLCGEIMTAGHVLARNSIDNLFICKEWPIFATYSKYFLWNILR